MTTAADRPIMVGVDGSEGAIAAVRWAARHAYEIGAPLRLVHAMTMSGTGMTLPTAGGADATALRRPGRSSDRILARAAAEAALYGPGVRVDGRTAAGAASPILAGACTDAALLVLGSRARGRVTAALFGSVAGTVTAKAPCPVVVVRGETHRFGPVVVAVENADEATPALRFAFREAARRRCDLVAVHAWQPAPMPASSGARTANAAGPDPAGEELRTERQVLTVALAPGRTAFPEVRVHERLLGGRPETAVADETAGAALAVVGSGGRGPLAGLLLGSTSQALVHASRCPVAVVGVTGAEHAW